jgi:RNA polymerase sigma factor (sigma-70 family)
MTHMATIVPVAPSTGGTLGVGGAPDAELVDGLRAGSRTAFEHLYELYRARIYNLALRIVQSPEDARDITQDVFVKVYRRLPGSNLTDLQLKPWLYRVAVNACYDHLRTRKVHRDIDVVTDTRATPVDTFEQAEMTQLVEQTLSDLSERHRTVLVLKDIHGLRHEEIAGILGITRGATETLLFRARESFRAHYGYLTAELPTPSCTVARDAAVTAVGGELSGDERRRILEHAHRCPACRATVKTWSAAGVGLGLFLQSMPLPTALQGAFPFGGAGAAAGGATGASAGTGAGVTGAGASATGGSAVAGSASVAAGGAGIAGGSSAGLSLATGGLLAKLGGAAGLKVAAVVIAATCTAGGGAAAYEADVLPGIHPHQAAPASSAEAHSAAATGKDEWTPPGLATAAASGGQGAARSAAAHDKGKNGAAGGKKTSGKEKGAANGKSGAQHGNAGVNGNAGGNSGNSNAGGNSANSNAGGNSGNSNAGGNSASSNAGGNSANSNAGGNSGNSNAGGNSDTSGSTKPDKPAKPTDPPKPDKTPAD